MIVAITGGIGSGKSFVSRLLAQRGFPVYDCDAAAKRLMRTSRTLQEQLSQLVGTDLFPQGELQKPLLRKYLLQSPAHAQAVDAIVHPAVARDFLQSGREWIESAILFDSHFDRRIHPDHVVCVTAPLEVRICRIMQRDQTTRDRALAWIHRQLSQDILRARSDFEIVNDGRQSLPLQLDALLSKLYNSPKATNNRKL